MALSYHFYVGISVCECLSRCLCRYLEVEWEVRKGSQRSFGKEVMKGSSPRVPQQDNFSDCGVYVLQYVESFFEVRGYMRTLDNTASSTVKSLRLFWHCVIVYSYSVLSFTHIPDSPVKTNYITMLQGFIVK